MGISMATMSETAPIVGKQLADRVCSRAAARCWERDRQHYGHEDTRGDHAAHLHQSCMPLVDAGADGDGRSSPRYIVKLMKVDMATATWCAASSISPSHRS